MNETFPLYVVVLERDTIGRELYYSGSKRHRFEQNKKPEWTWELTKAKFYARKRDARNAIVYHGFTGAIIKHVVVDEVLYDEPIKQS